MNLFNGQAFHLLGASPIASYWSVESKAFVIGYAMSSRWCSIDRAAASPQYEDQEQVSFCPAKIYRFGAPMQVHHRSHG